MNNASCGTKGGGEILEVAEVDGEIPEIAEIDCDPHPMLKAGSVKSPKL